MAEAKAGMTTAQKVLIFVPLIAVCIYAIVLGTKFQQLSTEVNRLNTDVHHVIRTDQIDSDHNPYVFTVPDPAKTKCDVSRAITAVGADETITFHSFDGSGSYIITFNTVKMPFTDPPPYKSDKEYRVKSPVDYGLYGYTITYNKQDCSPIENIGIIVTH